jgi:hypothetical protein
VELEAINARFGEIDVAGPGMGIHIDKVVAKGDVAFEKAKVWGPLTWPPRQGLGRFRLAVAMRNSKILIDGLTVSPRHRALCWWRPAAVARARCSYTGSDGLKKRGALEAATRPGAWLASRLAEVMDQDVEPPPAQIGVDCCSTTPSCRGFPCCWSSTALTKQLAVDSA